MHSLAALRLISLHSRTKGLETCCHRQQESKGGAGPGVHCYIWPLDEKSCWTGASCPIDLELTWWSLEVCISAG